MQVDLFNPCSSSFKKFNVFDIIYLKKNLARVKLEENNENNPCELFFYLKESNDEGSLSQVNCYALARATTSLRYCKLASSKEAREKSALRIVISLCRVVLERGHQAVGSFESASCCIVEQRLSSDNQRLSSDCCTWPRSPSPLR